MARKKIKKDFDRDQMYSKIMPSMQAEPEPAAAAAEPPAALEAEAILMSVLGAPPEHPGLHNYMEDILQEKIEHTMKVLRACSCERCRMDILALALNGLPPAYAVAASDDSVERIKKLRREYEVKVTAVLIKAIQQVKSEPRH